MTEENHIEVQPAEAPAVAPVAMPTDVPTAPPVKPVVQPAVVPEPAPEPVVQPQPEPVQAPAPTGIAAIDAAASIVAAQGIDPVALAQEIDTNGGLTPVSRAALESKLGAEQTAVLEATYKAEVVNANTKRSQVESDVYSAVGGKEEWTKIADWTKTEEAGLTEQAAEEYNSMLSKGGVQAQLAAKALKEAYMTSPGFKEPTSLVTPTAAVQPQAAIALISRSVYTLERREAVNKGDAVAVTSLDNRATYTMNNAPEQWRPSTIIN